MLWVDVNMNVEITPTIVLMGFEKVFLVQTVPRDILSMLLFDDDEEEVEVVVGDQLFVEVLLILLDIDDEVEVVL